MRHPSPALTTLTLALVAAVILPGEREARAAAVTADLGVRVQGDAGRAEQAPRRGAITVDPAEVLAGMFYVGATIRVSAVVPGGSEVAILCEGTTHPLVLNRKGKAAGLLWMNVGEVSFREVPDVYLLSTSAPLAHLQPVPTEHSVGFDALARDCGSDSDRLPLFNELVRLKERDGLWDMAEGAVQLQPANGNVALASTDLRLPAKAKPGTYRILVYTFTNGGAVLQDSTELQVRRVGMAAFIASLALRHGTIYGIMATTVAVAVGLLTGLFFGMGSKHGH